MSESENVDRPMYRHASVVKLTMDDPTNEDLEEGSILIQSGECDDGVSHTVISDEKEGFVDVECEVLETFEADQPMSSANIKQWGARKAKQAGIPESGGE